VPKKEKVGHVVSNKMNKTVVVEVAEYNPHPIYKKIIATTKNYLANDAKEICGEGDRVKIVENRPMSKSKRWCVTEVLQKAT